MLADLERRGRARTAAAHKLVARIGVAQLARARALMDTGDALATILRDRLYVNVGHASFDALLAALGIGRSQAFKWMALARGARAERVAAVGVEAAYAELATARRAKPERRSPRG